VKYITKKNLLFFFLTCLSIICIYFLRYSTGRSGSQSYQLGTLRITRSAISGIISGINALLYVLLVFTDYKKGIIVSLSLTAVSFINIIISIILSHSIGALPGIITNSPFIPFIKSFQSVILQTLLQVSTTAEVMFRKSIEKFLKKSLLPLHV